MSQNTILIVDDSEFDRKLLISALSRKGDFLWLQAATGEECLKVLEDQKVDLILMDIMMPGSLGTSVLLKIREKFNAVELPIIMNTSKTDSSDIVDCLQKGANDYITKPVNFDVATSRILTHLKLAETYKEMSRLKELAVLDAMITTYNHEINNPLAVAIGCINSPSWHANQENVKTLEASLWRISDIVKKIKAATDKKAVEFEDYAGKKKMLKV